MNKGKRNLVRIEDFYRKARNPLKLCIQYKGAAFDGEDHGSVSFNENSPVLILGKRDAQRIESFSETAAKEYMKASLRERPFFILLSEGLNSFPGLKEESIKREKTPVFSSSRTKKECQEFVKKYFPAPAGKSAIVSGGLLLVFREVGVLIIGDSGIGKSECALELISRGHFFISDDVTEITRQRDGRIIGTAPAISQNFMEIRGLGIINIMEIFGKEMIRTQSPVDLVIQLKKWKQGTEYDRLGLKFQEEYQILGDKVPQISIPVAPGRNIATLIEVACKVHLLQEKGYVASHDIIKRLNRKLVSRKKTEKVIN